jgi:dihydrofolate synthase/folylpolyglutamate synthase
VGTFTSPHLVRFEERLRIGGECIDGAQLVSAFKDVEAARTRPGDVVSLTYFEFTTLGILLEMARSQLDVVVLEVGAGRAVGCRQPDRHRLRHHHQHRLGPYRAAGP